MKKRMLSLLLCAVMLVSLLALPACSGTADDHDHGDDAADMVNTPSAGALVDIESVSVPLSGTYCAGDHNFQIVGSVSDGHDCVMGSVNYQITRCTKCGLEYYTAVRSNGAGDGGGSHSWVDQVLPGSCGRNPGVLSVCSVCGMRAFKGGGAHSWSAWTAPSGINACTESYTETRSCSCGATESRTANPIGHDFRQSVSSTVATCETPGVTVMECTRCHEQKTTETPALGHQYQPGAQCTDNRTCLRCGKTQPGLGHQLKWVNTDQGHYEKCSKCDYVSEMSAHYDKGDGYCICGRQMKTTPAKCSHNWTVDKKTSTFTHQEKCTLCGATRSVNCTQSSFYTPRTDCTTTEYCACGNVHREAQKNHNFGTWRCTDSTHTHPCLNTGCQYGKTEPHTYQTTSSGAKVCSVCNYTDPKSLTSHTHVWGVWTSSNGSTHSRSCTVAGCTAIQSTNHSLGTANCKGEAVCKDCGATVTGRPAGAHSGGTEIRNAQAAEVGKAGYTGDTYCLGCGKKISSGTSIPALAASHTHSYGSTWKSDSTHHWHECSCGDKQDVAEHTFKDGKCTVCGAVDPNYKAPQSHVHSWSTEWATSATEHWRTCSGCNETADRGAHIVVNEGNIQKCEVCGLTLGEIEQKEQDETQGPGTTGSAPVTGETGETGKPQDTTPPAGSQPAAEFVDVKPTAYYYEAAGWAQDQGFVQGDGNGHFNPEDTCNQAAILTMLWRAAGEEQVDGSVAVGADVPGWASDAVRWAIAKGIIDPATFDPNADCTRSTAVLYMWRSNERPDAAEGTNFTDVAAGSEYADAVAWAVESKIVKGKSDTTFAPDDICTRGNIVTLLYRELTDAEA